MARFLYPDIHSISRKYASTFLALWWFLGLCSGIACYLFSSSSLVSLMVSAVHCRISIFGLFISIFLPFLFAVFAVFVSHSFLLDALCFLKAASFSFVSMAVVAGYGSAGWLVWILLMFHDIGGCILLYLFALRYICGMRSLSLLELGLFFLGGLLLVCIGALFFSPMLSRVI